MTDLGYGTSEWSGPCATGLARACLDRMSGSGSRWTRHRVQRFWIAASIALDPGALGPAQQALEATVRSLLTRHGRRRPARSVVDAWTALLRIPAAWEDLHSYADWANAWRVELTAFNGLLAEWVCAVPRRSGPDGVHAVGLWHRAGLTAADLVADRLLPPDQRLTAEDLAVAAALRLLGATG